MKAHLHPRHALHRQQGLATLLVAVVMLIVLAFITLYSNRAVFIEQRTTTNQYKRTLALEAAQSGIDGFLGTLGGTDTAQNFQKYFQKSGGDWQLKNNYDNSAKLNTAGYLNTSNAAYNHDFTLSGLRQAASGTLPLPQTEAGANIAGFAQTYEIYLAALGTNRFRMIGRGCADSCDYSEAFVMIDFSISGGAICPLDINGALTVQNNASIHGITNGVNGFTCGISVGSIAGTTGDVAGCKVGNCSSSDKYAPPYEVSGTVDKNAHFQKYFSATPAAIKGSSSTCVISGNATPATITSQCSGKNQVWITGNLTVSSATGWLGVIAAPGQTLIVEGNLSLGNTLQMMGFLYVFGNTTAPSSATGAFHIIGGAAFAGDVTGNLSFNVTADTAYSKIPSGGSAKPAASAGSWRDF